MFDRDPVPLQTVAKSLSAEELGKRLLANIRFPLATVAVLTLCLATCGPEPLPETPGRRSGQLLDSAPGFAQHALELRLFASLGAGTPIVSMISQPGSVENRKLFITTQDGLVYQLEQHDPELDYPAQDAEEAVPSLWFDYDHAIEAKFQHASYRPLLDRRNPKHGGLRSVAFHPDFAKNGKLYTSAMVALAPSAAGYRYLGPTRERLAAESLVAEWTVDVSTNQVIPDTYRELFRVQMRRFDHPVKEIAFNDLARTDDADYGLLYITHGDGSSQAAVAGGGQSLGDALGKVLRIDPLKNGIAPYSTPHSPLSNTAGALAEIFTLGHRNPHTISFGRGENQKAYAVVADTGRNNIEEINLLQAGGNFGWSLREGTFVHNQYRGRERKGYGLGNGVDPLPANESQEFDFIYPAAQYEHVSEPNQVNNGAAVVGGFVVARPGADLEGQYLFADFVRLGHVFSVGFEQLLAARTRLSAGDPPSALLPAPIKRLRLTLDADADGVVDVRADTLTELFGVHRTDVRFGRGVNGEIYLSSKTTGSIYLVLNSL